MEVLVTTDHTPTSNTSITLWNPSTGTKLLSLKGPCATAGSLVLLRDEGLLIAEVGKPFVHLWQVGSPLQSSRRIICPVGQQKLGPMTASPDGNYIVVAISEKINVWQPATGRVVEVISSAHYRPVTVLQFTDDGTYLISGGADGIVSVWSFLQLVSSAETKPTYSWSHHTLPVTSLHVGSGGRKATLFTSSEDRFVKIYSLLTGSLVLSVAFPQPLHSIGVDRLERSFFVGGGDGTIYFYNLTNPPRGMEAQVVTSEDAVLKKHTTRVTALSISADEKNLASGDAEGSIFIWDLESRQAIRTIGSSSSSSTTGPVTNIAFWLNDPDSLKGGKSGKKPTIFFPEVPKLIEGNEDDAEGEELIKVWNRVDQGDEDLDPMTSSSSLYSSSSSGGRGPGGDSLAKINQLKMDLAQAKETNRKLHQFCVTDIFNRIENQKYNKNDNDTPQSKKQKKNNKRNKK